MLRMDQVNVIRHKVLIEGQSIRRVAREMGLSRLTVRKYVEHSEPRARRYTPRARPVWERVRPHLEELLAQWEPRTTAKQRLTGVRLHRALREDGYQVGLTMIHEYHILTTRGDSFRSQRGTKAAAVGGAKKETHADDGGAR